MGRRDLDAILDLEDAAAAIEKPPTPRGRPVERKAEYVATPSDVEGLLSAPSTGILMLVNNDIAKRLKKEGVLWDDLPEERRKVLVARLSAVLLDSGKAAYSRRLNFWVTVISIGGMWCGQIVVLVKIIKQMEKEENEKRAKSGAEDKGPRAGGAKNPDSGSVGLRQDDVDEKTPAEV